jgi:hypothetical protein
MIDVHPPHKAIGNTGEFFVHLFTITIGLLIAVGIEGCVGRYEHHELAKEAQQTMTAEIRKNASNMNDALKDIASEQKKNADNVASVEKAQLNPNDAAAQDMNIDVGYSAEGLQETAWKTAQATGALAYMPYKQSERYSDIYGAVETFLKDQDQLAEDEAQFLGIIQEFHVGKGKPSPDGANAMAKQLGIMQGHLLTMKLTARFLQDEQTAFLEGKEPQHHLSERLQN